MYRKDYAQCTVKPTSPQLSFWICCSLHKDAYSVIGGFADTLDLARKFIPRDCVPNYKLRSLAMTFFHLSVPNEAEAQAKAVKKIFKKYLSEHFDAGEVYTFDEFCKSVI